jgi:hypothetical protein
MPLGRIHIAYFEEMICGCQVEESLAISICCLAVEGKLDLISASDLQKSMNVLLCSSRKSPRLLALLRFFAGLFDREYGGNLSNALRTYFSAHDSDSFHSPGAETKVSNIAGSDTLSGRSSPLFPTKHCDDVVDDCSEICFSPQKQVLQSSDSESDKRGPALYSSLRPSDVMLCSLGPCRCCQGTVIAHIRAVSCAGCGHGRDTLNSSNFSGPPKDNNRKRSSRAEAREISGIKKNHAQREVAKDSFETSNKMLHGITHQSNRQQESSAILEEISDYGSPEVLRGEDSDCNQESSAILEEISDYGSPEVHRGEDSDCNQHDLSPSSRSLVHGAQDLVSKIRVTAWLSD